ncbi:MULTISPECIES: Crp/Fnr family transcriptional regulator [Sphingobacterium]|uniref:Crp/Fnr family transcriptional regulator n=1 Tax=Sphingobacterium populi TaxID=1812824 RepID=A0ABW5UCB0_9SPHI|nr:Crp/Fnr family transcriptional regulator [Sphingobacterium sp. CFCC 11742]
MDALRKYFQNFVAITDEEFELFYSKLIPSHFAKKSIILQKGEVENYLSFIEKGTVRFNIPKIDHDLTFGFAFENSFVSAYDSFLTQLPATYNIESINETILWRISYQDLEAIYQKTQIGDRIGRKVAETIYLKKMKREISLLEDTASTRYLDLLREQPELVRNIPLKYLASYIGIRPQSLSRIRRTIF